MQRIFLIPKEWNGFFVRVQMIVKATGITFIVDHFNSRYRHDPKPKYTEKFGVDLLIVEKVLIMWKHADYGELLELLDTLPTIKQESRALSHRQLDRIVRRIMTSAVPDKRTPHFRVPKKGIADVDTELKYPIRHELPPLLPPEPDTVTGQEVLESLKTWR